MNLVPALISSGVITILTLTRYIIAVSANPRAVSTAPVNPVREGDILGFHCKIWDLQSHHSVIISRQISTTDVKESLSWNYDILADVEERFFLAVRQLIDGSDIYFLIVNDVSREDAGRYFCQVLDTTQGRYILEEDVIVDVFYLPSANNPYCTSIDDVSVSVGQPSTFHCATEAGRPPIMFNWNRVSDGSMVVPSNEFTNGSTAYSEITLDISYRDKGAVFLCRITSMAFPEFSQTCFIGPLNVRVDDSSTDLETSSVTIGNTPVITTDEDPGQDVCVRKSCPLLNEASVFWITAFWAASLVAIILLVWIVYIHKQLRHLQRTPPPEFPRPPALPARGLNGEDIYVEMSNKSASIHDGSEIDRTYMTLEKPKDFVPYPSMMTTIEENKGNIDAGDIPGSSGFTQTGCGLKGFNI